MEFSSSGFDLTTRSLFRRDDKCVVCPPETPACPVCAQDEICTQISATCHQCPSRECIKMPTQGGNAPPDPSPSNSHNDGPNVAGIAGGVIGGVAGIAIITFLIWRFFIKGRSVDRDEEFDDDGAQYPVEKASNYAQSVASHNSTHTRGSVASTTFTRASNVIQIAFIPGITDRNEAPPVPPVPAASSHASSPRSLASPQSVNSPYSDHTQDHYFMPHDLRDSTWSGYSDSSSIPRGSMARSSVARSSMARQSITPSLARESVASTVFHHDVAVQSQAAQAISRARPNVVTVKQSPNGSPLIPDVPTVPKIDYAKYSQPAQAARVVEVSRSNQNVPTTNAAAPVQSTSTTAAAPQAQPNQSKKAELAAQIKEATRRASLQPTHGGLGSISNQPTPTASNPFADDSGNVVSSP